jgi:hypothetical protein
MKTGELIGVGAIIAIVLGILMTAMGPGSRFGTGWSYLMGGHSSVQQSSLPPASGSSIVGSPSLTAQQIDKILANAGSPAAGTGAVFLADSLQYGIDDAYALAFFHHESSFGTSGAAAQTLSIGNIVCTLGYSCIGRFRAYPSWQAGIDDWFKLIKNVYVGQWGATTVEAIIPHYAPSSDNNDEAGYISAVESDVNAWRQS